MIPVNWRRLWELRRLGSRSRRSRLQQIATRGQEPDLAHSKDSRSRRTSPPPQQDRSSHNCARSNTTVTAKCSVSDEGTDDLEELRGTSMKEFHSTRRDAQRRTRRSSDNPPPPGHPPHIKTTATSPIPAASRTTAKEGGTDDPKGARGRYTTRIPPASHATQSSSRQPLDDQPPHEYLTPVSTVTLRPQSASTTTQIEGQTNSPTSSGTKI